MKYQGQNSQYKTRLLRLEIKTQGCKKIVLVHSKKTTSGLQNRLHIQTRALDTSEVEFINKLQIRHSLCFHPCFALTG